jgi:hypothetical protein
MGTEAIAATGRRQWPGHEQGSMCIQTGKGKKKVGKRNRKERMGR